MAYMHSTSIYI